MNVVFSMQDIVKSYTTSYIRMGDQLRTLEPGDLIRRRRTRVRAVAQAYAFDIAGW